MNAYTRAKYQSDAGQQHPIRLSNLAYIAVGPTEAVGVINNPIHAKQSKAKREFGLRARHIVLARTVGVLPNTYTEYARLPLLSRAAYASAEYADGAEIEYRGVTWEIIAHVPESSK